jgi:hypothetical protein
LRLPRVDLLVPGAVALAVFAFWGATDGGYSELVFYPSGLLLLVLFLVTEWSVPAGGLGWRTSTALSMFAAFTGWSYLSIYWADDRGLALVGANRTTVYFLVFLIASRRPWSARQIVGWTGAWAFAIVSIGLLRLVLAAVSARPAEVFEGGRLTVPIRYANANAALFVLAVWPLLSIAQSRRSHPALRGLALAFAGASFDLALLAQSKGAALGGLIAVCFYLIFGRSRTRLAIPLLLLLGAVLALHGPLLDVYSQINSGRSGSNAIRSAAISILAGAIALAGIGMLSAGVDRRFFGVRSRIGLQVSRVMSALLVVLVGALAIWGVVRVQHPERVLDRTWHAFKDPAGSSSASSHFLTTAGNHRYDFWRVATRQFEHSPLIGAGVDNFAADYILLRRSREEPLYPHSLEASLLGGTGLVGFALFGIFVGVVAWACVGAARSKGDLSSAGVVAATMLVYWLAHGSVDWLWEFPALSAPVLFTTGCIMAATDGYSNQLARIRPLVLASIIAAGIAVMVILVPPWLAARDTAIAAHVWRHDSTAAYRAINTASRLNPLSDEAYVTGGTIAERRRDWRVVRRFFILALARNARNWYSQLELGLAESRLGEHGPALAALARARALNPQEPVVRSVQRQIRNQKQVSAAAVDRALLESTTLRVGR